MEESKERKAELHMGGNTRGKSKNGPDWALSVLGGVVSSVSSSSVVLCCRFRGVSHLSERHQQVSECVACMLCFRVEQYGPKQYRKGQNCDLGRWVSISMHHLLSHYFCLGGCCVFSGVSLRWV